MKYNRKTTFIVVGILLLASLGLVAFMLQPSAADLLTQALETMETITDGHAIVELEVEMPEQSASGTIEVWGKLNVGPNGEPAFRVQVLEASEAEAEGVIAVSDGSQFWLWHPDSNSVFIATAEEAAELMAEKMAGHEFDHDYAGEYEDAEIPETAEQAVAKLLEYFTAERNGAEDVAETAVYKIRLVPIPEQMPNEVRAAGGFINVWISADAQNRVPLAVEYAEGAVGYGKVMVTSLEFNQGVDDAIFTFEIPEGAEVVRIVDLVEAVEAKTAVPADFETLSPTDLPHESVLIDTTQVRGAVVQRYTLPDGKSFTVAQGPADLNYQPDEVGQSVTVRGVSAILYADDDGGRSLLSWTEGEFSFWVGGDLTADEAIAIAESLQ